MFKFSNCVASDLKLKITVLQYLDKISKPNAE